MPVLGLRRLGRPEGLHYFGIDFHPLQLQQFPFVRSVRLQADHHGPAKAGHYVQTKTALTRDSPRLEVALRESGRLPSGDRHDAPLRAREVAGERDDLPHVVGGVGD